MRGVIIRTFVLARPIAQFMIWVKNKWALQEQKGKESETKCRCVEIGVRKESRNNIQNRECNRIGQMT
jgi:hypothetical protein